MVDEVLRARIKALLAAVRERPAELPMAELVELSGQPVAVEVDRTGVEPVVFVSPRPDPRFDTLSEREYEVATLVAAGFSNQQIADTLFISIATVKDHVHSILAKTDLASRSEVAAAWYGRL
ncbi:MAG: response regulator transcription factor [Acidimicrobiia bacterium]|nr:response regulator transcription factor [Acidimicrobiia bacterium]